MAAELTGGSARLLKTTVRRPWDGNKHIVKVALYARVSAERQAGEDLSVPSQLKTLKRRFDQRNPPRLG